MEARLKRLRAGWGDIVFTCAKCSKKVGGGFGPEGDWSLAKALRRRLGVGKGRRAAIGIVEVKCLGVCPKRAIVAGRAGADWLIVPRASEVADVAAALRLEHALAASDRDAA